MAPFAMNKIVTRVGKTFFEYRDPVDQWRITGVWVMSIELILLYYKVVFCRIRAPILHYVTAHCYQILSQAELP